MPADFSTFNKKEEQSSYIGGAVSAVGGAVLGAGSMISSGVSYLGIWKGSNNK